MKIILNKDVKHLGEEGDIKNVAGGYARNYLFPHNLAFPCTDATLAQFASRKSEIEARKAEKRKNSAGLKEKLQGENFVVVMPAGQNGKLYGAVTTQTIAEVLHNAGYDIERKKIELPGLVIKHTGKYHFAIRLYESDTVDVNLIVKSQEQAEKDTATEKALSETPEGTPETIAE